MTNSRYIKEYKHLKTINSGATKLFTPKELFDLSNEYFQQCIDNPWKKRDFIKSGPNAGEKVNVDTETMFTWQGLYVYLGVNKHYINDLEGRLNPKKRSEDTIFAEIIAHIRNVIVMQRYEGAACGAFNVVLVSRLEGLAEKQEIEATNTNISVNVQDPKTAEKLKKE